MNFAKRITALGLTLALCVSPALAAGVEDKFPAIKEYPGYTDVPAGAWFEANAKLCYEVGLMNGTALGFEPERNMLVSEVAVIAARIREAVTGEAIVHVSPKPGEDLPWYFSEVEYLKRAVMESTSSYYGFIDWDALSKEATRHEFLVFLALAVENHMEEFPAINTITSLPDVHSDNVILFFYNAGILTGTDKYGTFTADKPLTRQEGAAMVSRVVRESLRKSFTPADYTPFTAAERYLTAALTHIAALESSCRTQGIEFNWFNTVGDQTFLDYVKETSLSDLGVTKAMGTDAYRSFDLQVFYSRYLDLKGAAV